MSTPKKTRKAPAEPHRPPAPYQIHRPAFTDGSAPAPAVVAVDAQPRAGEYPVPITFSTGGKVIGTGTIIMTTPGTRIPTVIKAR